MNLNRSNWKKLKIGDLCKIQYGSSERMSDNGSGFKTFRMNEISEGGAVDNGSMKRTAFERGEFEKYRLNYGDILFNRTNSYEHVGRTGIFQLENDEYMFASYLLRLSAHREIINPFYLNVVMNSPWFQREIKRFATKAVNQANINAKSLAAFEVPVPPLQDQEQIANLFHSIDGSIQKIKRQAENLTRLSSSLVNGLLEEEPKFGNLIPQSGWERIHFSEAVDCIDQHDRNPLQSDLSSFVGLEHIQPGAFELVAWGNINDGTTFTKRFRQGDVLFGKRRAYLRKVAVAPFDGICSSDILVFRSSGNKILNGLLPFYVSSDAFIQYAVSTSAGSLSPRTKWRDLAKFEFQIPEPSVQSEILDVLVQIQNCVQELEAIESFVHRLKEALLSLVIE